MIRWNSENTLIICPCAVNNDFIFMKVLVIGFKVVKWRWLVLSLNFPLLNCFIPCTCTSCFSFSFESGIVEKDHFEYDAPPPNPIANICLYCHWWRSFDTNFGERKPG